MAESKSQHKKFKPNTTSVSDSKGQVLRLKSTSSSTAAIPPVRGFPAAPSCDDWGDVKPKTTLQVEGFNFLFDRKPGVPTSVEDGRSRGRGSQQVYETKVEIDVTIMMPLNDNEDVFELDLVFHKDTAMLDEAHKLSLSTERELNPLHLHHKFAVKFCQRSIGYGYKDVHVGIEVRTYTRAANEHKEEFSAYAMEFMKELYDSRDSTGDVKIVSGTGTEYNVHKLLLVHQSPVLKAAFEVDMKEKEQNAVKLDDLSDKAVKSLIDFLYKGWTSAIEEEIQEMLQIAHLYQVEKLSNLCWDHVLKTLSKETVFDCLVLAHRIGAEDQKIKFAEYLNQHYTDLKKTSEFDKFVRENTPLYLDVCKI